MTAFLKIYPIPKIRNIPIYRLAYNIAMYRNISYRNPCIVIRIVSPDSCQYTALMPTCLNSLYLFNPNTKYRDIYRIPQISQKIDMNFCSYRPALPEPFEYHPRKPDPVIQSL